MAYPSQLEPDSLGTAALAFVEERGWEGWSLREVAGRLNVSPNALYRYVDGKKGLELAMGEAAALALSQAMRGVEGSGDDRVVGVAHCYVQFSMDRPHAFSAFVNAKPLPDHPRIAAWLELWRVCLCAVAEAVPESPDAAAFALWALMHGRAELARGPARTAAPTAGLEHAVRALLHGYQSLGPIPSPLPAHVPRFAPSGDSKP